ncbi:hypothetical protein [Micromonospora sp. S-DT3-3-22]|uniref:TRAFAC clade GTPase domain-containing protein n=1 Tax=Micromonospora sp. S-DT3-3-22 TaxID=2755359 RepID=UPI00188F1AA5|nr:hypothetical protein [Micromonospora sp. S-DT3-3-22]
MGLQPCPHFAGAPDLEGDGIDRSEGRSLPWSGLALGLADLSAVAALGRPHLVGVVGAANAGKTTLLAAHWLAARRGVGDFGYRFAGSYTLIGWHQIARHLQWVPHGRGFPPHTTAPDNRTPALLHTAVSIGRDSPTHVLHTDVPGEWYSEWAYDVAQAPGAAWIAEAADAFVILADSDALAGPERGTARGDYETLAGRLASVAQGRPVVPVQTKADIRVPGKIQAHIDGLNARLFGAVTVRVSVHDRDCEPVTAAIDLGTAAALAPRRARVADDRSESNDSFLAFRSAAGQS